MKLPGRILLEHDVVVTAVITTEGTFIISQEGKAYRCELIAEPDGTVSTKDETATPAETQPERTSDSET